MKIIIKQVLISQKKDEVGTRMIIFKELDSIYE